MRNLRKVMACVLALVMCLSLLPGTANAAYDDVSYAAGTYYVGENVDIFIAGQWGGSYSDYVGNDEWDTSGIDFDFEELEVGYYRIGNKNVQGIKLSNLSVTEPGVVYLSADYDAVFGGYMNSYGQIAGGTWRHFQANYTLTFIPPEKTLAAQSWSATTGDTTSFTVAPTGLTNAKGVAISTADISDVHVASVTSNNTSVVTVGQPSVSGTNVSFGMTAAGTGNATVTVEYTCKARVSTGLFGDDNYVTFTITQPVNVTVTNPTPAAPTAPAREELAGLLGSFVQVECASSGDGLPHDAKTYSTVSGHDEARVGAVYQDGTTYKVDVTVVGSEYAEFYGYEPIFGTGVTHKLAEGEQQTKTFTLTWDPTAEKWTSGQNRNTALATFQVVCKENTPVCDHSQVDHHCEHSDCGNPHCNHDHQDTTGDGKCDIPNLDGSTCGACLHNHEGGFCTVEDCTHGTDCCTKPQPEHVHKDENPEDGFCDDLECGACLHTKDTEGNCTDPNCTHGTDCCPKDEGPVTPETTYTVTFCANGGTFGSGEHVVYSSLKAGETVNVPANPTRAGYTFNGWDNPAVQQGFVTVTGNETYYAQWTEIVVPEPVPEYHLSDALAFRNENRQQIGGVFLTEGVVWNDGDADVTNVDFELTLPAIVKLQEDSTITIISTGSEELSADDITISDYDEVNGTTLTWHLDKFEKGASLIISLTAEGVKAGKFTATLYTTSDEFEGLANSNARSAVAGVLYATAEGTVICPSNEHKWSETSRTEATCGANGSVNYVCRICDETKTETIPATGHAWGAGTVTTPATCTSTGIRSYTCSNCGETKTETIPAKGHTAVTDPAVAPTCTANGKTAGSHCSTCGTVLTAQQSTPATGHSWGEWQVVTPAAVGVEGREERTCSVCGATDSRIIPALDEEETPCAHEHTTTAVTKAASCEAAGEQTVTCDDCGALVATNPIPATGHSWDAGTVTTAATATTDGVRTYVCRNDPSHTRTETIPATGVITTPTPVDPTPADPTPAVPAPADPTPAAPAETDVPDAGTPLDDGTDIQDGETPLAGAFGLDNANHFAYMLGYGDGTIRPEANITRAEVATIFFRLMTDEFRSANWATENDFSDVSLGQWFNNAISTSANAGKLGGYGDGSFRPNNNITRAEFAAIAVRFLSDEVQGVSGGSFKDTEGHWAAVEIGRAAAAGWITGYGDGTFRPDEYITRAEAAAIINRMLGRVPDAEHLLDEMTVWSDNPATQWYYADIQEATNSHAYDRDELGVTEMWTALQETRDWQALESQWAAQAE